MFGSSALDFAIGMTFVYLTLSLSVTALSEGIASAVRRRSRTLFAGINNLLRNKTVVDELYQHPLIQGLHSGARRPSYIPSRLFALVLLDNLTPKGQPPDLNNIKTALAGTATGMEPALRVLFAEAGGDLEKFKINIEVWFNDGMERVAGWYKRYTQAILLALAAVLTVAVNADSLSMAQAIWRDPTLRAQLVAEAAKVQAQPPMQLVVNRDRVDEFTPPPPPPEPPEQSLEAAVAASQANIARLEQVHLPIGWSKDTHGPQEQWGEAVKAHGFGWFITILAISLGAPFWFDLLNKFMSLRGAGKAPEEKQKDPKREQPPMGPGESPAEARENEAKEAK